MAGTYSYRIASRDLDSTGRARLCALGELVLEAAGDDADTLGLGVGDLQKMFVDRTGQMQGLRSDEQGSVLGVRDRAKSERNAADDPFCRQTGASWVLSRMAMEFSRLPERGETVDIYTWVSDYGRLVTTRNMVVGNCGHAVTQWAMIDLATRRPLDLSSLENKGASLINRTPPIDRPRKVAAVDDEIVQTTHTVVYSDIDFNGHVNSMKYLEWMVDLMPAIAGRVRIDLNYLHEAVLGEELTIRYGRNPHTFDIRNAEGAGVCRAAVELLGQ